MNLTVAPERVQMLVVAGSTDKVTGRPELAVAATAYVLPYVGDIGAVDVKVIVCAATVALAGDRPMPPTSIAMATAEVAAKVFRILIGW